MISIILPTYNEPLSFIECSINSILNQTYQKFELMVVIDSPNRQDLIGFIRKKQAEGNRIKIILNAKNLGLTASLNKAIDLAKGDYIARMDADDISIPERLEKQLDYLKQNDLDLVGCFVQDIDSDGNLASPKPTSCPINDADIKKALRFYSPLAHPTWLGKAKLFKTYKYIDFPACEDYEFLTRIAIDNKKIGNLPEVLLKYRLNASGISSSKKIIQKTSFSYIKKRYKNKRRADLTEFNKFIKTPAGKRKQKSIARFYRVRSKMKTARKTKKIFYIAELATCKELYISLSSNFRKSY